MKRKFLKTMDKDTILFVMNGRMSLAYHWDYYQQIKNNIMKEFQYEIPSCILFKAGDTVDSWIDMNYAHADGKAIGILNFRQQAIDAYNKQIRQVQSMGGTIPPAIYTDKEGYEFFIAVNDGEYQNINKELIEIGKYVDISQYSISRPYTPFDDRHLMDDIKLTFKDGKKPLNSIITFNMMMYPHIIDKNNDNIVYIPYGLRLSTYMTVGEIDEVRLFPNMNVVNYVVNAHRPSKVFKGLDRLIRISSSDGQTDQSKDFRNFEAHTINPYVKERMGSLRKLVEYSVTDAKEITGLPIVEVTDVIEMHKDNIFILVKLDNGKYKYYVHDIKTNLFRINNHSFAAKEISKLKIVEDSVFVYYTTINNKLYNLQVSIKNIDMYDERLIYSSNYDISNPDFDIISNSELIFNYREDVPTDNISEANSIELRKEKELAINSFNNENLIAICDNTLMILEKYTHNEYKLYIRNTNSTNIENIDYSSYLTFSSDTEGASDIQKAGVWYTGNNRWVIKIGYSYWTSDDEGVTWVTNVFSEDILKSLNITYENINYTTPPEISAYTNVTYNVYIYDEYIIFLVYIGNGSIVRRFYVYNKSTMEKIGEFGEFGNFPGGQYESYLSLNNFKFTYTGNIFLRVYNNLIYIYDSDWKKLRVFSMTGELISVRICRICTFGENFIVAMQYDAVSPYNATVNNTVDIYDTNLTIVKKITIGEIFYDTSDPLNPIPNIQALYINGIVADDNYIYFLDNAKTLKYDWVNKVIVKYINTRLPLNYSATLFNNITYQINNNNITAYLEDQMLTGQPQIPQPSGRHLYILNNNLYMVNNNSTYKLSITYYRNILDNLKNIQTFKFQSNKVCTNYISQKNSYYTFNESYGTCNNRWSHYNYIKLTNNRYIFIPSDIFNNDYYLLDVNGVMKLASNSSFVAFFLNNNLYPVKSFEFNEVQYVITSNGNIYKYTDGVCELYDTLSYINNITHDVIIKVVENILFINILDNVISYDIDAKQIMQTSYNELQPFLDIQKNTNDMLVKCTDSIQFYNISMYKCSNIINKLNYKSNINNSNIVDFCFDVKGNTTSIAIGSDYYIILHPDSNVNKNSITWCRYSNINNTLELSDSGILKDIENNIEYMANYIYDKHSFNIYTIDKYIYILGVFTNKNNDNMYYMYRLGDRGVAKIFSIVHNSNKLIKRPKDILHINKYLYLFNGDDLLELDYNDRDNDLYIEIKNNTILENTGDIKGVIKFNDKTLTYENNQVNIFNNQYTLEQTKNIQNIINISFYGDNFLVITNDSIILYDENFEIINNMTIPEVFVDCSNISNVVRYLDFIFVVKYFNDAYDKRYTLYKFKIEGSELLEINKLDIPAIAATVTLSIENSIIYITYQTTNNISIFKTYFDIMQLQQHTFKNIEISNNYHNIFIENKFLFISNGSIKIFDNDLMELHAINANVIKPDQVCYYNDILYIGGIGVLHEFKFSLTTPGNKPLKITAIINNVKYSQIKLDSNIDYMSNFKHRKILKNTLSNKQVIDIHNNTPTTINVKQSVDNIEDYIIVNDDEYPINGQSIVRQYDDADQIIDIFGNAGSLELHIDSGDRIKTINDNIIDDARIERKIEFGEYNEISDYVAHSFNDGIEVSLNKNTSKILMDTKYNISGKILFTHIRENNTYLIVENTAAQRKLYRILKLNSTHELLEHAVIDSISNVITSKQIEQLVLNLVDNKLRNSSIIFKLVGDNTLYELNINTNEVSDISHIFATNQEVLDIYDILPIINYKYFIMMSDNNELFLIIYYRTRQTTTNSGQICTILFKYVTVNNNFQLLWIKRLEDILYNNDDVPLYISYNIIIQGQNIMIDNSGPYYTCININNLNNVKFLNKNNIINYDIHNNQFNVIDQKVTNTIYEITDDKIFANTRLCNRPQSQLTDIIKCTKSQTTAEVYLKHKATYNDFNIIENTKYIVDQVIFNGKLLILSNEDVPKIYMYDTDLNFIRVISIPEAYNVTNISSTDTKICVFGRRIRNSDNYRNIFILNSQFQVEEIIPTEIMLGYSVIRIIVFNNINGLCILVQFGLGTIYVYSYNNTQARYIMTRVFFSGNNITCIDISVNENNISIIYNEHTNVNACQLWSTIFDKNTLQPIQNTSKDSFNISQYTTNNNNNILAKNINNKTYVWFVNTLYNNRTLKNINNNSLDFIYYNSMNRQLDITRHNIPLSVEQLNLLNFNIPQNEINYINYIDDNLLILETRYRYTVKSYIINNSILYEFTNSIHCFDGNHIYRASTVLHSSGNYRELIITKLDKNNLSVLETYNFGNVWFDGLRDITIYKNKIYVVMQFDEDYSNTFIIIIDMVSHTKQSFRGKNYGICKYLIYRDNIYIYNRGAYYSRYDLNMNYIDYRTPGIPPLNSDMLCNYNDEFSYVVYNARNILSSNIKNIYIQPLEDENIKCATFHQHNMYFLSGTSIFKIVNQYDPQIILSTNNINKKDTVILKSKIYGNFKLTLTINTVTNILNCHILNTSNNQVYSNDVNLNTSDYFTPNCIIDDKLLQFRDTDNTTIIRLTDLNFNVVNELTIPTSYRIQSHSKSNYPYNIVTNDIFTYDQSYIYTVLLIYRSGYKISGICKISKDLNTIIPEEFNIIGNVSYMFINIIIHNNKIFLTTPNYMVIIDIDLLSYAPQDRPTITANNIEGGLRKTPDIYNEYIIYPGNQYIMLYNTISQSQKVINIGSKFENGAYDIADISISDNILPDVPHSDYFLARLSVFDIFKQRNIVFDLCRDYVYELSDTITIPLVTNGGDFEKCKLIFDGDNLVYDRFDLDNNKIITNIIDSNNNVSANSILQLDTTAVIVKYINLKISNNNAYLLSDANEIHIINCDNYNKINEISYDTLKPIVQPAFNYTNPQKWLYLYILNNDLYIVEKNRILVIDKDTFIGKAIITAPASQLVGEESFNEIYVDINNYIYIRIKNTNKFIIYKENIINTIVTFDYELDIELEIKIKCVNNNNFYLINGLNTYHLGTTINIISGKIQIQTSRNHFINTSNQGLPARQNSETVFYNNKYYIFDKPMRRINEYNIDYSLNRTLNNIPIPNSFTNNIQSFNIYDNKLYIYTYRQVNDIYTHTILTYNMDGVLIDTNDIVGLNVIPNEISHILVYSDAAYISTNTEKIFVKELSNSNSTKTKTVVDIRKYFDFIKLNVFVIFNNKFFFLCEVSENIYKIIITDYNLNTLSMLDTEKINKFYPDGDKLYYTIGDTIYEIVERENNTYINKQIKNNEFILVSKDENNKFNYNIFKPYEEISTYKFIDAIANGSDFLIYNRTNLSNDILISHNYGETFLNTGFDNDNLYQKHLLLTSGKCYIWDSVRSLGNSKFIEANIKGVINHNGKYLTYPQIIRSENTFTTWSNLGHVYKKIISINDKVIGISLTGGIYVSGDDGVTWDTFDISNTIVYDDIIRFNNGFIVYNSTNTHIYRNIESNVMEVLCDATGVIDVQVFKDTIILKYEEESRIINNSNVDIYLFRIYDVLKLTDRVILSTDKGVHISYNGIEYFKRLDTVMYKAISIVNGIMFTDTDNVIYTTDLDCRNMTTLHNPDILIDLTPDEFFIYKYGNVIFTNHAVSLNNGFTWSTITSPSLTLKSVYHISNKFMISTKSGSTYSIEDDGPVISELTPGNIISNSVILDVIPVTININKLILLEELSKQEILPTLTEDIVDMCVYDYYIVLRDSTYKHWLIDLKTKQSFDLGVNGDPILDENYKSIVIRMINDGTVTIPYIFINLSDGIHIVKASNITNKRIINITDVKYLSVDSDGDMYLIKNTPACLIDKIDFQGNHILTFGGSGSTNGVFGQSFDLSNSSNIITVDKSDNVYIFDELNYRVQKFDRNGLFVTNIGEFGEDPSQLNYTTQQNVDLQIDDNNNIVIYFKNSDIIKKYRNYGTFISSNDDKNYDIDLSAENILKISPTEPSVFTILQDGDTFSIKKYNKMVDMYYRRAIVKLGNNLLCLMYDKDEKLIKKYVIDTYTDNMTEFNSNVFDDVNLVDLFEKYNNLCQYNPSDTSQRTGNRTNYILTIEDNRFRIYTKFGQAMVWTRRGDFDPVRMVDGVTVNFERVTSSMYEDSEGVYIAVYNNSNFSTVILRYDIVANTIHLVKNIDDRNIYITHMKKYFDRIAIYDELSQSLIITTPDFQTFYYNNTDLDNRYIVDTEQKTNVLYLPSQIIINDPNNENYYNIRLPKKKDYRYAFRPRIYKWKDINISEPIQPTVISPYLGNNKHKKLLSIRFPTKINKNAYILVYNGIPLFFNNRVNPKDDHEILLDDLDLYRAILKYSNPISVHKDTSYESHNFTLINASTDNLSKEVYLYLDRANVEYRGKEIVARFSAPIYGECILLNGIDHEYIIEDPHTIKYIPSRFGISEKIDELNDVGTYNMEVAKEHVVCKLQFILKDK